MRAPLSLWQRLVIVGLISGACAVPAYGYVSSHDLARTVRQFNAGKRVEWPPPPKQPAPSPARNLTGELAERVTGPAKAVGFALLAGVALMTGSRVRQRRLRQAQLATFELRPSHNDVSHPFRVREAFEAILGALSVPWYERAWRGQDHLALEMHRLPDGTICFTIALARPLLGVIAGPLGDLYPDAQLIEQQARPSWGRCVVRLKKRRRYLLSLHTTRSYEHSFCESLAAMLSGLGTNATVQLVLVPAPSYVHSRTRRLLKQRERQLNQGDRRDPLDLGVDSVVEAKELAGALETQHRSLCYFDLRISGNQAQTVKRIAGSFSQLRSENELAQRRMRLRRRLYVRRIARAAPNPVPGWRRGILSTSELANLWQLPGARAKHTTMRRAATRRAAAPHEIDRDPALELLQDDRGPVGLHPDDRKYGQALIGGQGGGKTSCLARHLAIAAIDPSRALVLIDGKGPLAKAAPGLIPTDRTVHYLDLAQPELGINPLDIGATPGATAAVFVRALVEANPPGAIQAASDSFLRQAIAAVCAVEPDPTLWHVYRMLDFRGQAHYRETVIHRLETLPGSDFALNYWRREFPALIENKGFAAPALNPPRNKLERLISTRETDLLLRHPNQLSLADVLQQAQVLIVNAAKGDIGEDNARLIMQLLLALLHRQLQAQQHQPHAQQRKLTLLFDEAHNVLTPAVATMLAEGRSAGLEAVFAWQYSAQIADHVVRSGVRSLLQSISIFRMRELEDARSLAGLAMDVYSDRISTDQEDQARLRFSADDITRLDTHHAINLWIANGTPQPGFIAQTLPWEHLHNTQLAEHHRQAQHDRGGHCPDHLPDPTIGPATSSADPPHPHAQPDDDTATTQRRTRQRGGRTTKHQQLVWDDLEELG
jgi:hypothetical protein